MHYPPTPRPVLSTHREMLYVIGGIIGAILLSAASLAGFWYWRMDQQCQEIGAAHHMVASYNLSTGCTANIFGVLVTIPMD